MLFILSSCLVKADNEIEEDQEFLDEGEISKRTYFNVLLVLFFPSFSFSLN